MQDIDSSDKIQEQHGSLTDLVIIKSVIYSLTMSIRVIATSSEPPRSIKAEEKFISCSTISPHLSNV
ncbi:hypothetical protein BDB01DRAFT_784250 [Pilobolus umbonatus]|nr:hypothetical protein BDB01DRAFT_784250 [Pilobolus umbonatus]